MMQPTASTAQIIYAFVAYVVVKKVVIVLCVCSLTTESVITQVKKLFKGHRDLILGLNVFLPEVSLVQMCDASQSLDW